MSPYLIGSKHMVSKTRVHYRSLLQRRQICADSYSYRQHHTIIPIPKQNFVQEGQWLKSVIIPTEPEPIACHNLSARDVYEVLRVNARCQGRVLVLTNPPLAVAEPVLASMSMDDSSFHTSRTHQSYHTAPSVASSNSVESSTTIDATIEQSVLTIATFKKGIP